MITIIKIENETDLHCQFQGQTNQQPCYVELDCANKTLAAYYSSEIGGAVPFAVYHGHDQRWGIPCLRGSRANELLGELAPLAERIVAGYTSEWDGNNNVARFDADATAALEAAESICDDLDNEDAVDAWDAGDYLAEIVVRTDENGERCQFGHHVKTTLEGYGAITAKTTDDEIGALVEKIEAELEGHQVINGLDEYLTSERDGCCSDDETCAD